MPGTSSFHPQENVHGVLLFKLCNVPGDKTDEIRQLLSDHGIGFYETSAGGGWSISLPAVWLSNEMQLEKARSLLDVYQQQRQKSARDAYEQLRIKSKHRTDMDKIREAPLLTAIYLAAVLIILYISIMPFLGIFR